MLDSGDPAAAGLTTTAAVALAGLAGTASAQLSSRHGAPAAVPVVLAGGLMKHDRLRGAVISELAERLPASAVSVLTEPPVAGAVRLAAVQAGQLAAGCRD